MSRDDRFDPHTPDHPPHNDSKEAKSDQERDSMELDEVRVTRGPLDPSHRAQGDLSWGTLWVIGVPIGHLEDITLRAIRLLKSATLIACEDTRTTRQLLTLLEIPAPKLLACHEHNEAQQSAQLIRRLQEGEDVVLVSDAGTPNISDPGYRVINAVIDAGLTVSPIPGPCAAISALCASGLPTDRFRFIGFLPSKESGRRKALQALNEATETLIFYESPHRLDRFLSDASEILGAARRAVVARELTKRYEEFRRGSLGALSAASGVNRGEVVVLVEGLTEAHRLASLDLDALITEIQALDLSPSARAKQLSRRSSLSRQEAYDLLRTRRSSTS